MPSPVPRWTRWVRSLLVRRIPAGPWSPATTAFPRTQMGRRPRQTFRGLIGCSLSLRPACSRDRQSGPLRRRLRQLRYLHRRSDCYRLERTSCRVGIAPTEDLHLITAHCVPVSAPIAEIGREPVPTGPGGAALQEAKGEETSLHDPAKTRSAATPSRQTGSGLTGCHSGSPALSMQAVLPRPGTTENPPENVDFWPG